MLEHSNTQLLAQISDIIEQSRKELNEKINVEMLDVYLSGKLKSKESDIEQAIINDIQKFLLELGKGFAFVERQKRIGFDDEEFYIDLVFYNFKLKCFLLIDLKLGKLKHQDIGQMDTYVRLFDEQYKGDDDNPTIGLVLCSEKSEAVVKYSILAEQKQLFSAKYLPYLPTENELKQLLTKSHYCND